MSTFRESPPPPEGAYGHVRSQDARTAPDGHPPAPEGTQSPSKGRTIIKIVIGVVVCFVIVQIIAVMVAVGAVTVGVASCSASVSDMPTHDSQELAALIKDRTTNSEDLKVLDALQGSITAALDPNDEGWTFEQLRAVVSRGSWPTGEVGDTSRSTCPQLWVRLAESCAHWLTLETDEYWEVVDFAYPFPSNGPIPWPARRDQYDTVSCRLVCTGGPDRGLYVDVDYFRWSLDLDYESNLEMARERRQEGVDALEQLRALEGMEGRLVLLDAGEFYVWETGEDDPLRDPDTFVAFANRAADILGDYADITLVAHDTPVALNYYPLSYDYPNEQPEEELPVEEAQERLLLSGYAWGFYAPWDEQLLSGYRYGDDERIELDDLSGQLAPKEELEPEEDSL